MLGMMNCPSDSVEFYHVPTHREEAKEDDVQVFLEQKDRPHVSYTDDGRKLLDGLPEPSEPKQEAVQLWGDLLMRTRAKQVKTNIENKCIPDKQHGEKKPGPTKKVQPMNPLTILKGAPSCSSSRKGGVRPPLQRTK